MKTIAVVLAGGRSSRMGRDKANLEFNGVPMLRHLIEKYAAVFDEVCVSVNQKGRFDTAGARELVDHRPGQGPIAGLETAFLETDADIVFLTATDLPFGDPDAAKLLTQRCVGHDACVFTADEPLFGAYARSCLPVIQRRLDEDMLRLRRILKEIDTLELGVDSADTQELLMNVNDPEEYYHAIQKLKKEL